MLKARKCAYKINAFWIAQPKTGVCTTEKQGLGLPKKSKAEYLDAVFEVCGPPHTMLATDDIFFFMPIETN